MYSTGQEKECGLCLFGVPAADMTFQLVYIVLNASVTAPGWRLRSWAKYHIANGTIGTLTFI